MTFETLITYMAEYKEEMTAEERMEAYLKGEEVDHIPYSLNVSEFAAGLYGYTIQQYRDYIDVQLDVMQKMNQEFGMKNIRFGVGLKAIGISVGSKAQNPANGIDYIDETYLKDYQQLSEMKIIDVKKCPNLVKILENYRECRAQLPEWKSVNRVAGPMTTAVGIRAIEQILRDTIKNKENLHRLLSYSVNCTLQWIKAVTEEFGPIPVSISEPVGSLTVLSKKQFLEFEKPHLIELVKGITDITGLHPGLHICGRTKDIWNDLTQMGFSSLGIDNIENLQDAKNEIGDKIRISGNVPPVDILKAGTVDQVIDSVKDCLLKGADSPKGYILAPGCQIPPETPRENLYAYIYAARKYGKDAKIGHLPLGLMQ